MKTTFLTIFFFMISGCSSESNPLGYLVLPSSRQSFENLIYEAEAAMDRGDYKKAIEIGEKAYELDSGSERLAVVLGFAYMSIAGIDPMSLAEKLIEQGESEDEDKSNSLVQGESEASEESSNPLAPLRSLLGLEDDELSAITLDGNVVTLEDGSVIEGAPKSGPFKDYPVLLPKTAPEARKAGGLALTSLAKAIKVVCPFVSTTAKVLSPIPDSRHASDSCPPSEKELRFSGKIHFVWSFAHLTEAIAFNSIVLYDPSGAGANIIRRSESIRDPAALPVDQYLKAISELAVTLDLILPTSPESSADSMLFAMVNDLQATSRGFNNLPGMPESMTKPITDAIARLEEQQAQIEATGVSEVSAGSSVLKDTLTESLGENVRSSIEAKAASGELNEEEKKEACASYASISSEALEICQGS